MKSFLNSVFRFTPKKEEPKRLTIERFKDMPAGHIFARGYSSFWGDEIYYIAIKSRTAGINDWACYYVYENTMRYGGVTDEWISNRGFKIVSMAAQKITGCTDELITFYRK